MFKRYCWVTRSHDSCVENNEVNRGYKPVIGRTSGGKPCRVEGRVNIKELISRTRCRIRRETGLWARECPNKGKQVHRDGEEAKTTFFVYSGWRSQHTMLHWKGRVIDTGLLTLLDWTKYSRTMGTDARKKSGVSTRRRSSFEKAMTFRFGNDETLETRTTAILFVGIAGVRWSTALCTWYLVAHHSCCRRNS